MDGGQMRQLRRDSGLLQNEVAYALGVWPQTVHRWEHGKVKIGRKTQGKFITLINDEHTVSLIKDLRPARVRGRPFQKKNS